MEGLHPPGRDRGARTVPGGFGVLNVECGLDLTSILGHEVSLMPAAPRPQTDEPPDPAQAEGWALLDGLRRRMDEQANQSRKTQNEVRQLADSIAAMVDQQRKRSRWVNVNSFAAYVMFTLLCGGAFYFLYQSRAHDPVAQPQQAAKFSRRVV